MRGFDALQSGLVFLLLLAAGGLLSRFARGAAPAVLFAGVGYALLCWAGILPEGLADLAGFSGLTSTVMMLVVVHMGASMDLHAFLSNWRVAALAAVTFAGQRVRPEHGHRRAPRRHGHGPHRPGAGPVPGL